MMLRSFEFALHESKIRAHAQAGGSLAETKLVHSHSILSMLLPVKLYPIDSRFSRSPYDFAATIAVNGVVGGVGVPRNPKTRP